MKSVSKHGAISSDGTDTAAKSKRIRFDEEGEVETPKKLKLLLQSDDEDEDEEFTFPDDSELNFKSKAKLSKLQSVIGNDERFIVDERFLDDEDLQENQKEETNEYFDEKKKELEILGGILGKPIFTNKVSQNEKDKEIKSAKNMIRYDPTDKKHQKYEIVPQNPEKVKKKKKKETENVKEPEPILVSKEIFYSVSDKLMTALGGGREGEEEQFSLLKAFGKESTESNIEKTETTYECDSKIKTFGFNFDSSKAFTYDSSDDEEVNENFRNNTTSNKLKSENVDSPNFNVNSDRFLFVIDDPRFHECEEFFMKRSERCEDLNTLRPKLKQTIRKKIRTNLKKHSAPHQKLKKKKY